MARMSRWPRVLACMREGRNVSMDIGAGSDGLSNEMGRPGSPPARSSPPRSIVANLSQGEVDARGLVPVRLRCASLSGWSGAGLRGNVREPRGAETRECHHHSIDGRDPAIVPVSASCDVFRRGRHERRSEFRLQEQLNSSCPVSLHAADSDPRILRHPVSQ